MKAVFSGTQTHLNGGTLPLWCSPGSIGYQPYFTSPLTSLPGGTWYTNGSVSAGATGLSSSGSGSAILAQAGPGNANFYLVDSTLNLTGSGGTFITYLHATSNAKSGASPQGTFYSVEIQNVVTNGAQYSGTLAINRCLNGSLTQFASFPVNLGNGSTVRTVMTAARHILVFIDGVFLVDQVDSSITSGQPGLGVSSTGSNSISAVSFGPYDGIAPTAISASTFAATVKKTSILLRWRPTVDDANGSGIWRYDVTRWDTGTGQPVYLGAYTEPVISDTTMTPGHSYVYQVAVSDYFENGSYTTSATLVVPTNDDIDPRQVGVRPNGTYWGGAGEQINMRSGNVNFTVPLMKAMARSGWGVGFSLSYNSQNWLQDAGYSWKVGNDVGFGFGWKLQAGSLTPVYNGYFTVAYYQFVDASGAEYRLLPVGSGIFASSEAIYLWFDSNAARLYFKDGSFWIFGCTSAGTEQDAGTLYPTTMEDTNGNQITIQYGNGLNATWPNSSARIGTVWDVRGNFTFNYTQDALPHISSIWSPDNNNYSFTIPTGQALNSPFGGASFGNTAALNTLTEWDGSYSSPSLSTTFTYDPAGSGELTKMTTPYGGYLNCQYGSSALSEQRTVRYNPHARYLQALRGGATCLRVAVPIVALCARREHWSVSEFKEQAGEIRYFIGVPDSPGSGRSQDMISGNMVSMTFSDSLKYAVARTLTDSGGNLLNYVILGRDFYGDPTESKSDVLLHEALHVVLNLNDSELKNYVSQYGFTRGYGGTGGTDDITQWLKANCPK